MLTIGYIGNGKSTNRYHLPYVLLRDHIKVKTIYNPRISHEKWKKAEGIVYTTDLNELLCDPEIGLVVICTVQKYHYAYAKMALDHGKNVLVEKPFMETLTQAEEIFTLAENKGLLAQCYQNRRYDSDFLTVQRVLEEGRLGDWYEIEMHFDYYRPKTPMNSTAFEPYESYLYGHGCHTLDQVVSYFGVPDSVTYDVRCLLGKDKMNDYFDLDLFYGNRKISVKSSYFRIKSRPSFVIYGKKGMFVKHTPDRQEEHLKLFYMPGQPGFGLDELEHYGTLTCMDEAGLVHEERVPTVPGDYGRVYDRLYDSLADKKPQAVTPEQTRCVMKLLETGIRTVKKGGKNHVF